MKAISKAKFDALCRVRQPFAHYISREVEWFSDEDERVLGLIMLDLVDHDWVWMILGRDEAGLFRCIDLDCSIPTQEKAQNLLKTKLDEYSRTGKTVFAQGDVKKPSIDLFTPVVDPAALNENFRRIMQGKHHAGGRTMLTELARAFVDVDGNFLKDFQTTGFNARLWELYLSAFLYEQACVVAREFNRPDFCLSKDGFPIGMEAVTANPTAGESSPKPKNDDELRPLRQEYMPIKFGSALYSKLQNRYWELPHMDDKPFILAIHDFCGDDSMTWSAPALSDYLYGLRATWHKDGSGKLHVEEHPIQEHRWGKKRIPSGFFNQPETENVSAILFSNAATISKFDRMGKLAGFGEPGVKLLRVGTKLNPDPDATEPIAFCVEIEPGMYSESWTEGIQIYHNPRALLPIPPELFAGCAHHSMRDGRRIHIIPDSFVYSSNTIILAAKENSTDEHGHRQSNQPDKKSNAD